MIVVHSLKQIAIGNLQPVFVWFIVNEDVLFCWQF